MVKMTLRGTITEAIRYEAALVTEIVCYTEKRATEENTAAMSIRHISMAAMITANMPLNTGLSERAIRYNASYAAIYADGLSAAGRYGGHILPG